MKYILDYRPDVLYVFLEGTFTFADARRFRQLMVLMTEEEKRLEIRLNVKRLHFVDSTAIILMMLAHDLAKQLKTTLVFEGAQGQVFEALQEAAQHNPLNMS